MKRFNWLLIGSVILILAMVLLVGCGVSQSDYEAVEAELAEIKEVYPPKDFPSLTALNDWLLENDVSEKPATTYADDWYSRALEVQEDALEDGYVISAGYHYHMDNPEEVIVLCIAIINGRIFYWDPETDEVFEDYVMGTVK